MSNAANLTCFHSSDLHYEHAHRPHCRMQTTNTCLHERVWQAMNRVLSLTVADSSSRTGCLQPVVLGRSMASQTCKDWLDPPAGDRIDLEAV